ncbi:regulatory protein, Fis family [Roseateles sp. YR242]|uniref:sigma 54-interacting transcriptional regulator n=1 Tax=Roseateles sp. YR242 TaxID=1855305 RepID=UPI0008D4E845|nr:sigma-54 dependent transcriptional regulator [Roseateles sp. YR242]SEK64369.1 regulatory protein, Fis family [Roseateles sp. YR242]
MDRLIAAAQAGASVVEVLHEPAAWQAARRLAPLAVDMLLQGETGAGKDALAREIHEWSGRHGKFIAINCAAIPEHLAESELFGHEAGAFTGAARSREGKFELADKGTLYLDEIDSMPLAAQVKLLRALQERGSERLGGSRFIRADFRVLASTKVPLPALVKAGRFRQDLYFRLNVVRLCLPALRDSPERVVPLFAAFAAEAAERHQLPNPPLGAEGRRLLLTHTWPGNVRELRNAAERHVLGLPPLDDGGLAAAAPSRSAPSDLDGGGAGPSGFADLGGAPFTGGEGDGDGDRGDAAEAPGSLRDRMRDFEKDLIVQTLRLHGGSVAKASAELRVPANTLYYRIKTLGIQFTAG